MRHILFFILISLSGLAQNFNVVGDKIAVIGNNITTPVWTCGQPLVINHIAGTVAPQTVSITYGTVMTSLTGSNKCWITRNLGATTQATAVNSTLYTDAGWYFQFNRKQGYYQQNANGALIATALPSGTIWDATNDNLSATWEAAKDPCTIELGSGWRIPTNAEWITADGAPQSWATYIDDYNSVLKLHAAGYLFNTSGTLTNRGAYGNYWSSSQDDATHGWYLSFGSGGSYMSNNAKAYGFPVRCLRD